MRDDRQHDLSGGGGGGGSGGGVSGGCITDISRCDAATLSRGVGWVVGGWPQSCKISKSHLPS